MTGEYPPQKSSYAVMHLMTSSWPCVTRSSATIMKGKAGRVKSHQELVIQHNAFTFMTYGRLSSYNDKTPLHINHIVDIYKNNNQPTSMGVTAGTKLTIYPSNVKSCLVGRRPMDDSHVNDCSRHSSGRHASGLAPSQRETSLQSI